MVQGEGEEWPLLCPLPSDGAEASFTKEGRSIVRRNPASKCQRKMLLKLKQMIRI